MDRGKFQYLPKNKTYNMGLVLMPSLKKYKIKVERAIYLRGCAYNSGISTFQLELNKGHFLTWSDIGNINFKKS